jgi:hypothetical protein
VDGRRDGMSKPEAMLYKNNQHQFVTAVCSAAKFDGKRNLCCGKRSCGPAQSKLPFMEESGRWLPLDLDTTIAVTESINVGDISIHQVE